jgi:hypothetical protein
MDRRLLDLDNDKRYTVSVRCTNSNPKPTQNRVPYFLLFYNTKFMGDRSATFHNGRQQLNGTGLHVLHHPYHNSLQPRKKYRKPMEKIMMWGATSLGLTSYVTAILLNIDNWKSIVLFIIAALYGIVRLIVYVIKARHDITMRRLEREREKRRKDNEIFS